MPLDTYANLKASVVSWSKRNDVANVVDDFIDLAEAEMNKYIRIRDMEAKTDLSASSRYVALPSDFIEARRLRISTGGRNVQLSHAVPEALIIRPSSGLPKLYTITSQIELDITPDTTYTLELQYYQQLTALSSSNTANAILTRFPNIYLFGCLWALFDWCHEDVQSDRYYQKFINAIKQANDMDAKGRIGPTPAMRIDGPTP